MAHPNKRETESSHAAKLKSMTSQYGAADPAMRKAASVTQYKQEGPEDDVGFGADSDRPSLHGARRVRAPAGGNAIATYKRGGKVKHRADGGVADVNDIEDADIKQKLEAGKKRGGRIKRRADGGGAESLDDPKADTSQYAVEEKGRSIPMSQREATRGSQQMGQAGGNKRGGSVKRAHGGRIRGEEGPKTVYPPPVKGSAKDPTVSTDPSPTKVDNRARGGRTGKKGGTHVNVIVAPQHGQPGAGGMPPISAIPTPPPMPARPPMGPPGAPPMGGPPMMPPPGGMPPGMPPPGAIPPGMPPRKRGGRIMAKKHHSDEAEDMSMIKRTVKESALKSHGSMRAAGGRIGLTAGAASGEGRLEKEAAQRRRPGRPQAV